MSQAPIRFGTDGWRGVISRDFTFDAVRRVAMALALHLEEEGSAARGVAVGYDRRLLSDRYAAEIAGVLNARKIPVHLGADYLPTPVVSWSVRELGLAAGVMVTASHNPPEWNGIKIKESYGGPSTSLTNRALEEFLDSQVPEGEVIPFMEGAKAKRLDLLIPLEPRAGYLEKLAALVDFEAVGRARAAGFDAMHGCGAGWTDRFLEDAGCRVKSCRTEYNPGFGGFGPEPVEERLGTLLGAVASYSLALGVANDGDADRIAAVDERGRFFSPQRILAVLAAYLWEVKGHRGDVAKTVSATSMLDLLAARYGVEVIETPVGFRHTAKLINERKILIGGEESGAVGIGAHIPERDGVANALLLAEIVGRTGLGLREYLQTIFDRIGYFTYRRADLRLTPGEGEAARALLATLEPPATLCGLKVAKVTAIDGLKLMREDHSWLLIRPSGTEPLLRVYAEARSEEDAISLLQEGRRLAGI